MNSLLPESDRILLGPGPSLTSPRIMRAYASPARSSGTVSMMGRTCSRTLKLSVSSSSIAVPVNHGDHERHHHGVEIREAT